MSQHTQPVELVRHLALSDLDGALTRRLHVPQGSTGVVMRPDGQDQVYPAGVHTVMRPTDLVFGRTAGWRVVLLPAGVFPFSLPVPRLRAGDGVWVDITVGLLLRVIDPAQAAKALPSADELAADLSAAVDAAARQAVTQWAAADLARAPDALVALLSPLLEARLRGLGLTLQRVLSLTVRGSDEAVDVARKMAEVDVALAEVEMDRRMAALTSQAEWFDFARQVEADFGLPDDALAGILEAMGDGTTAAHFRQAVAAATGSEMAALTARVQRLAGQVLQPPAPPAPLGWEPLLPIMKVGGAAVLVLGLLLFALAPFIPGLDSGAAGSVLGATAVLAAALVGGGLWLDRKAAVYHRLPGTVPSLLERLGRGERQRIDRLVRGQLAREFEVLGTALRDARNRAYRDGLREAALALKDVEGSVDRARRAVEAESFGQAAYLAQADITREQLDRMLRYDEELLAHSAALGDLGAQVRQACGTGDAGANGHIHALQAAVAALEHQIQARARFIQAPVSEV